MVPLCCVVNNNSYSWNVSSNYTQNKGATTFRPCLFSYSKPTCSGHIFEISRPTHAKNRLEIKKIWDRKRAKDSDWCQLLLLLLFECQFVISLNVFSIDIAPHHVGGVDECSQISDQHLSLPIKKMQLIWHSLTWFQTPWCVYYTLYSKIFCYFQFISQIY